MAKKKQPLKPEKEAFKWATTFIKEKIDTEGKFVPDAMYEIQGSDLHTALVQAYMSALETHLWSER